MTRRRKILVADLLCGAGGSSTGCARALAELGLEMELVCVNHWGVAIETHKRNHPEARHYVQDISTVRPHLIVPEGYLDLLMASPTCFPAGTLVLTEHGPMPIETVEVGTRVLTHKGRWRPVTARMSAMKTTVVVRGHGHFGIETTAEHPFLVCQRKAAWRPRRFIYGEPEWRSAQSLVAHSHFWATPTSCEPLAVPPMNDRALAQTVDFWWFVGRWLGDGYFAERHQGRAPSIIVCCAEGEADRLERRLNFAPPRGLRAGENELRWHRASQPTGVRFETNHASLAEWLRAHFGKLAHGKTMPAWVLGMPEADRRALLDGYLSADGWSDHRKREAYTVSRRLAVGIRLLAESLGHRVALHLTKARQNPIEGRQVTQRDQYHLVWVDDRKRQQGGESAGHSWLRVRSIEPGSSAPVPVFNISVAEDESYVAEGIVVHNCTHHSVARGGKPTSDQQRSDPWHIITWLTELRVKRIIIENVWEFIGWGPVDTRTGKPVKSRKGEYFHAWIETIRRLGFEPEWRKLNAADYGDATTRQRFILMARSDRKRVVWPMPTHTRTTDGKLALFPGVQPWRPARAIIDWSIKGRSIFDRKKPLAPKTLARIYAGAVKFGWPEPFLVILRNHMDGRSTDDPLPTIAANGNHIGLAQPFVMATGSSGAPREVGEPLPTITTGGAGSDDPGCARPMLAEPFVCGSRTNNMPKSTQEPVGGITTTTGGGQFLVEPFVLSRHGEGAPRSVEEPTPTQVAKHSHVLISPYYGSGSGETCQSAEEPLPTLTGKNRFGMVVPVTHSQGGNAARDIEQPLPTMTTAKGGEFAMVMPVTHADSSDRVRATEEPLPTVTGANRGELAFIAAQFGERDGQAPRVHDVDQPTPAITATGHINLVEATQEYDILFRMLEPHELAAAMGFDSEESRYEFAGTKTEKIKQIGNAVSVRKMKACVASIMSDAAVAPDTTVVQRAAE